jgi:phosphomevalonate kinase
VTKVCAPGKLFIAGEWAVLKLGNPGIVAAVDKMVYVEVNGAEDESIHISIQDFDVKDLKATLEEKTLTFERELTEQEKKHTLFMKAAIEATLSYLQRFKPFHIRTWGEETTVKLGEQTVKIGFGSSAAAVVATVAAILRFHGEEIESLKAKEKIYKIATIAHYLAQGKLGSGFDVAASVYGGVFVYKRFDARWLTEQLAQGKSFQHIVKSEWPGFYVEPLNWPRGLKLLVGWTKQAASTSAMVKQLNERRQNRKEAYDRILSEIADTVGMLIDAWKDSNKDEILRHIKKNKALLSELTEQSGVSIETPELRRLGEIAEHFGGAGKPSGAGGGDCGIALCFDRDSCEKIKEEWRRAGIVPVDVNVCLHGVTEKCK